MLFYRAAFDACLLLLCVSCCALVAAQKKGDKRQARVLHFFRLGLGLSAFSYLLRIISPPPASHASFPIFVTCLAGTTLIWLGWREHWKMHWERRHNRDAATENEEGDAAEERNVDDAPTFLTERIDTSHLTPRARRVLLYAQDEAQRRRQCGVDTDHLLLGLLREPHCTGVQILNYLNTNPEKVHLDLRDRRASHQRFTGKRPEQEPVPVQQRETTPLALTGRAQQVISLAAQEAHRFNTAAIGTEHLLLGLVLMGTGPAASVLFQKGLTVDRIRDQIMRRSAPTKF